MRGRGVSMSEILIRGAGHLPCVEKPAEYAALLTAFLRAQGAVG